MADTDDPRREVARRLRREGRSLAQIQQAVGGMSNARLSEWLRDLPIPGWTARPRAKDEVRAEAVRLRMEGLTYDAIEARLGVSKSSLSLWLRHLPRPERDPEQVRAHVEHMQAVKRRRAGVDRAQRKLEAATEFGDLSARELFVTGVALYWAEGTKDKPYARREQVIFVNSDARVIEVFERWLDLMEVPKEDRGYRVSIHESADVAAAEGYWADVVGVERTRLSRTTTIKKHRPATNRLNVGVGYHGCLVIRVRRSRALYQRIEGWWYAVARGASGAGARVDSERDPGLLCRQGRQDFESW